MPTVNFIEGKARRKIANKVAKKFLESKVQY